MATNQVGMKAILQSADAPDHIALAGGIPDPDLFPIQQIQAVHQHLFSDDAVIKKALQYSTADGDSDLKTALINSLLPASLSIEHKNILITQGVQQGLDILCRHYSGFQQSSVVCTEPTYPAFLNVTQLHQQSIKTVDLDEQGLDIHQMTHHLEQGAAWVYLNPSYQNPTGCSLAAGNRQEIFQAASQHGVPIIEDTTYDALFYSDKPYSPIAAYQDSMEQGAVIQVGTVSKIMVPGYRIGWIVADEQTITQLSNIKQSMDLCTSPIVQQVIAALLSDKEFFNAHLARLRAVYHGKCQAMCQALQDYMPRQCRWTIPQGGMFVWVTLPEQLSATRICQRLRDEEQVMCLPGQVFYQNRSDSHTLRLSFSLESKANIRIGIEALARVIDQELSTTVFPRSENINSHQPYL